MSDHIGEQPRAGPARTGVLQPGRWLPARALAWGVVFAFGIVLASALVEGIAAGLGMRRDRPLILLSTAVAVLAALAVYLLGVRFIERRTPDELALNGFARELAAGLLFGAATFAAVMGVLVATGAYTLTGPTVAPPWRGLAIALSSGVVEELVFRGVLFRLLWCAFGIGWGLAVSAGLFGLAHLANPPHDIMAALAVALEAGLMLAALYVLTGRLWASIGAHIAWNFTQGYVFGARVSGVDLGPSLYRAEPVAGAGTLWTGGPFGPEASWPAVLLGCLSAAAILALAARRARAR